MASGLNSAARSRRKTNSQLSVPSASSNRTDALAFLR